MLPNFKRALEGIVVCDFSWVGAGPIATNILGQCGARIIKIESIKRPDILRKAPPFKDGIGEGVERSGYFANRNPNKESIALDMTAEGAREIVVRMLKQSDVVINNFRVGQMEKWGLGWEDVKAINPRLIYVTMSLQGTTGPHKDYMGFGVNLNGLAGLTARAGAPGDRPFGTGTNYTDHVMVPTHTLFGLMAALLQREKTGEGQTVTLSQLESAISMVPTASLTYAANGEVLTPLGDGDPDSAPHGVFNTLGYRKWLAIAVREEDEWDALKKVMGRPQWAENEKFSSLSLRKENEQELNAYIEDWTSEQYADRLMDVLLRAGVKAAVVNDARGVIEDDHLKDREFFAYLDHPVVGKSLYHRAPILFSKTPIEMKKAAPVLGQDTEEVLSEMLGYSADEIESFQAAGILT